MMAYYQDDGATTFRFQIAGELTGPEVTDLEHAWQTATSILAGKQLLLDLSDVTGADPIGVQLLQRMLGSGAQLISADPPAAPVLLRSLGAPVTFRPRTRTSKSLRTWLREFFNCGYKPLKTSGNIHLD